MNTVAIIWVVKVCLYVLFLHWYVGPRKRIKSHEVDDLLHKISQSEADIDETFKFELRKFLENDDGKSIVMVNLLQLNDPKDDSYKKLKSYSTPFMFRLFLRAGHPVFFSKALCPSLEYWGLEKGAESWDMAAAVRYRSRRDLIEMVLWPRFRELHPFKEEALKKTLAFPASPWVIVGAGVKTGVAFVLILVALLLTLAIYD